MVNSFDNRAANWDENPKRIKLVEEVWSYIQDKIDFNSIHSVLDYGCGTGLLGYKTINNVETITFCDSSEGMLEMVEKKRDYFNFKNVNVLNADFTKDSLPEKGFDLILSMLVLHHIPQIEKIISQFKQTMNNGGIFCWIDLDKEDGSFHTDNSNIPHFGFSKDEIDRLLKMNNLTEKFFSKDLFYHKETEEGIKKYPLFVLIAQK